VKGRIKEYNLGYKVGKWEFFLTLQKTHK